MAAQGKISNAQKYDRQIRIWGDEGQAALQRASVCVINSSATATEILKNLVLPGISSFTIIDGNDLSETDKATNFFLTTPSSVTCTPQSFQHTSKKRAHAVVEAMLELNESVRGAYIPVDASTFLTSESAALAFLRPFSIVVATQLSPRTPVMRAVSAACARLNIPLLLVRSYGLAAYVRVQVAEHCVHDARTADAPPDLRLHAPFPELADHVRATAAATTTTEASTASPPQASQIPFVLLLSRAVTLFRQAHDGRLPATRDEKDAFAACVRALRPKECPEDAENFGEALRFAHLRLCHAGAGDISPHVLRILHDARSDDAEASDSLAVLSPRLPRMHAAQEMGYAFPEAVRLGRRTTCDADEAKKAVVGADAIARENVRWWTCAAAVRMFWKKEGCLPLSGRLPDMTADTASYVKLQRLYSERAQRDARAVSQFVAAIVEQRGHDIEMDFDSIAAFCRRVSDMRVVRTRTLVDEVTNSGCKGFVAAARDEGAFDEGAATGCAAPYYAMLRAVDLFEGEHGRFPGGVDGMRESDVCLMHDLVAKVRDEVGVSGSGIATWREITEEMVRFGGVETHCVAAFIGGIAAQEVTKLITAQFVPLCDTIVFNMATVSSVAFRV